MKQDKIKLIYRKLSDHGIKCKVVKLSEDHDAIMCDTDYEGMYPSREVFEKHSEIARVMKRRNDVKLSVRGCYVSLMIEIV